MAVRDSHIGQMRSVVQMLKNNPTPATTGGQRDVYGVLLTTRGRLRKSSGGRTLSFAEIVNAESYRLITRYQQGIENDLRVDSKFIIDGLVYTLNSWDKYREINFYYLFDLSIYKGGSVTVAGVTPVGSAEGVQAVWLTTAPGATSVYSAALDVPGITILAVEREGTGFSPGTPPGNKQFWFVNGTVSFEGEFNVGEMVYVLYKT